MNVSPPTVAPYGHREIEALGGRTFDTLIIGGGINGAGLARDLAMRGLDVLLIDKGDYANGTSSASTKLIHGGLRYLENLDFGLVFEACRERAVLQRIAAHLVQPLPFFLPVYRGDPRPLWLVRAGLMLYDALAVFRNTGTHRILSPRRARERAAILRGTGLTGAARYWDCRMDDARLCLENVLGAREAGAVTCNYLEAVDFLYRDGQVCGARLRDGESHREVAVSARCVVNASGLWLDRVRDLDAPGERLLRPTRGTHILVPRIGTCEEALYLTAGSDERMFFVIPWGELSLIGTTDVDYTGDPDHVVPSEEDIAYLLEESRRYLQGVELARADVVAAFAGLRPLIAEDRANASRVSREHRIVTSPTGLVSVGGGKYTTYRAVAEELADLVLERLGRSAKACTTDRVPLPGGAGLGKRYGHRHHWKMLRKLAGLNAEQVAALASSYGARTSRLLAMVEKQPELGQPVTDSSRLLRVQVAYAVRHEMARCPTDVLRRRTALALEQGRGRRELHAVSDQMASLLEAGPEVRRRWLADYDSQTNL